MPLQMMQQILNETFRRPINLSTSGRRLEGVSMTTKHLKTTRGDFAFLAAYAFSIVGTTAELLPLRRERAVADLRVFEFLPDRIFLRGVFLFTK